MYLESRPPDHAATQQPFTTTINPFISVTSPWCLDSEHQAGGLLMLLNICSLKSRTHATPVTEHGSLVFKGGRVVAMKGRSQRYPYEMVSLLRG